MRPAALLLKRAKQVRDAWHNVVNGKPIGHTLLDEPITRVDDAERQLLDGSMLRFAMNVEDAIKDAKAVGADEATARIVCWLYYEAGLVSDGTFDHPMVMLASRLYASLPKCLGCRTRVGVELESSRTHYTDPAANAPLLLCRDCAEEHHANWDAQWAEYHSGLM